MTLLTAARRSIAVAALCAATAVAADAQQSLTLTFDDVATNAAGLNNNFTADNGFNFFGFNVATSTSLGAGTNAVSGTKFALGREGGSSFYRTDLRFSLFDAWLSFRQFDVVNPVNTPVTISVYGFRTGIVDPVFQRLVTLTNVATRFQFDWSDLEEVSFDTAALTDDGRSVALALDNVSVNVVPEPATLVLTVTGMLMLVVVVRSRRKPMA